MKRSENVTVPFISIPQRPGNVTVPYVSECRPAAANAKVTVPFSAIGDCASENVTVPFPPALDQRGVEASDHISAAVRKRLWALLERLTEGRLTVIEGDQVLVFGPGSEDGLAARIHIAHPSFFTAVALRGSLGAAEAYMEGHWNTNDLTDLVRLFARNKSTLESMEKGTARLSRLLLQAFLFLKRNTRRGSRKNIHDHYDLGNEFFRLFLDETLMYSSAVFESEGATLHQASLAKLDRICRKLRLQPNDHVVEIGSGWGGFALYAASEYGCRVTTTTVSDEQYQLASSRVREAGLADKVQVLKKDYRDLSGVFDKLVSIEMIEAVGHEYLETYFLQCDALLRPGGRMVLQAIAISEEHFEASKRSVDFIKRYIFPGSALPAVSQMQHITQQATLLRWEELEDISSHYARTLRAWRERFLANLDRVRRLGFSERFIRMWEYYLCYCEAGFLERHIRDVQITMIKDLKG